MAETTLLLPPPLHDRRDDVALRLQRGAGELAGRLARALGTNHPAAGFLTGLADTAANTVAPQQPVRQPVDRLAAALRLEAVELDLLVLAGLSDEHEGLAALLRELHPNGLPHATSGLAALLAEAGLLPGLPGGPAGRRHMRRLLTDSPLVRSGALRLSGGAFWERSLTMADGLWAALQAEPGWPPGVTEVDNSSAGERPASELADAVRAIGRGDRVLVIAAAVDTATSAGRLAALLDRAGTPAVALRLDRTDTATMAAGWLAAAAAGRTPVFAATEPLGSWPDIAAPIVLATAAELPRSGRHVLHVAVPVERGARRPVVPDGGTRVVPSAGWDDLVLPQPAVGQLQEAVSRVRHGDVVLDRWGFLPGRPGRRGVRLLFCGPPGTGKTLAAEVLAGAIGRELLIVDLSRTVSKWIGETEKNLAAAFDAAERGDYVLLFDEADALFARRTEVGDARDRYANLETSYLLSRLSWFDGVAVLATNLRQNLDVAFGRRLEFVIPFDLPGPDERRRLWRAHLPCAAPLAADVELDQLAAFYPISGALIRNAALGAAYLAADQDEPIGAGHFAHAVHREYRKAGLAYPGPLPDAVPKESSCP